MVLEVDEIKKILPHRAPFLLVDRIIDSMVSDGYFRECPITFRDIQYSKTVLIEKLKTIYHTRISYPELKSNQ